MRGTAQRLAGLRQGPHQQRIPESAAAMNDTPDQTRPPKYSSSDALTQYRLSMIETTLKTVSETLARLATLEARHGETREAQGRAFDVLEKLDGRLKHVEMELPTLKLVRSWVIGGVIGCSTLLMMALAKLNGFTP
jgi:hypothetical protein